MLAPLIVSFIYKESLTFKISYIIPIVLLVLIGSLLQLLKPKRDSLYQKEGFALVALVWVVMTLFGAIPFVINGDIPNYIDACFEIMSGFTTTGSSIVTDVTALSYSTLFWRSFSHWIGGMGILVFILIFIPESDDGSSMHLLRAESPGPKVGKIASKMKATARILYLIYLALTILEVVALMLTKNMIVDAKYEKDKFFYSLLTTFGTAGTGGFGFIPNSLELFSPAAQYIVATFLILYGINFSLYFLILIGKAKDVFKSEELRTYFAIVIISVAMIFINIVTRLKNVYTNEEAFRHAYFQVASIITTCGYSSTDFNLWPMVSKMVIIVLMFIGGMAGSTAGGIKTSRIVIGIKGMFRNIRKLINPRYIPKSKFEGKVLDEDTFNDVFAYISIYCFLFIIGIFILAFDPINGQTVKVVSDLAPEGYEVTHGFTSNFTSVLACISNIGPGLEAVGPYSSFALYSPFTKVILTLLMLIGRLEILPVLILFSPKTWTKS